MRRSLAKFSESEASNHTPSLADFTTTTPELKFSVHTSELKKLAERGGITYYKELGKKVGRHERWPKWKDVLDTIAAERPNISILVLNARSGWSGQIGGKPVVDGKPTDEQKRYAQAELVRVFEKYARGKTAPTLPLRKAKV
jgi:hypothetical protein